MKKFFVTLLGLASLMACNNEEKVGPQPDPILEFSDTFIEVKTRGAANPSITTQNIDAFYVWAYMDIPVANVFDGELVQKQDNEWKYEPLHYWVGSRNYYFGAIAPVEHANISVDASKTSIHGLGEISFTNLDGTDDLIYASKKVTTSKDVINDFPEKVSLQFAHLLSKIKFTFTNGFPNKNTKLVVKNIKMEVPQEGTINVAEQGWRSNANAWEITDKTLWLEFGDIEGGAQLESASSGECEFERLTISGDETRRYNIAFDVEVYQGDYDVPGYAGSKNIVLTGEQLKMGKHYNLKATIDATNILPEGELSPIKFDLIEVDNWIEEEDIDNKI